MKELNSSEVTKVKSSLAFCAKTSFSSNFKFNILLELSVAGIYI